MTQVSRYGHMLKVTVGRMRMRVTARYRVTGSVLDDTVQGEMLGADTVLELDSPDPPDRVARLVRNAERGCFRASTSSFSRRRCWRWRRDCFGSSTTPRAWASTFRTRSSS